MISHSIPSTFVSLGVAAKAVGLSQITLRNLLDRPECSNICYRSLGGHRKVDLPGLRSYLKLDPPKETTLPRVCLLCRVSSPSQAKPRTDAPDAESDLDRQVTICRKYIAERWGGDCVVTENIRVGSGLHFEHPKMIEFTLDLVKGQYDYVCFTYKDRVCRSAFSLYSKLAEHVGTELVMIEDKEDPTFAESLVDEIIALTCVASARHNGNKFGERVRINVDREVMIDLYLEYLTGITFDQLVEYCQKKGYVGTKGETLQKQKLITLFKKNRRVLELAAKERPARENTLDTYFQRHEVIEDTDKMYEDYCRWCADNGKVATTRRKMAYHLRLGKAATPV